MTVQAVIDARLEYWRTRGLAALFEDNIDFHGPYQHSATVGHVIQLGLALHLVPVFASPHEAGFQPVIEPFDAQ
jgi:hypothetical protein